MAEKNINAKHVDASAPPVLKKVGDYLEDFNLQKLCAESLSGLMEDVLEDNTMVSVLDLNHPWHPAQQMYALITSVKSQLGQMDKTVHLMEQAAKAVTS